MGALSFSLLSFHYNPALVIYRNTDEFVLLCYDNPQNVYHLEITDMRLFVKTVNVVSSVALSIEKTLASYSAKYPMKRVQLQTIHVSENRTSLPENHLFSNVLPKRILVACVNAKAFDGSKAHSPFFFEHFNIRELSINAAGSSWPATRLTLDFENNLYTRAYVELMEGLGLTSTNDGNVISLAEYKSGWTIFCIDLQPTQDPGSDWQLAKTGTTSLSMEFSEPVPSPGIVCLVYAEFDGLLTIDKFRNSFIDHRS